MENLMSSRLHPFSIFCKYFDIFYLSTKLSLDIIIFFECYVLIAFVFLPAIPSLGDSLKTYNW